jgi:hypothetical protein
VVDDEAWPVAAGELMAVVHVWPALRPPRSSRGDSISNPGAAGLPPIDITSTVTRDDV